MKNGIISAVYPDKTNDASEYIKQLEDQIRELQYTFRGTAHPEYKSRLFSFLFGREEHKEWTLSLYNAINGTSHTDPNDITINTIEDVIYLGMKNDLSIIVSEIVNLYKKIELYEQQSSYNPNMPVRQFMYAGKSYDKYIFINRFNRYGTKLIPLPIPKLVVFYNGTADKPDDMLLSLDDAYKAEIKRNITGITDKADMESEVERLFKEADPDIRVKVRMININYGHSKNILEACKPLKEYSWFVDKIRSNNDNDIESAIAKAIDEMPDDFEIKFYILANRAEVMDMCLTEYNEVETMNLFKEEGRLEGREEGRLEGRKEGQRSAAGLMNFLWSHGRGDDAIRAGNDEDYLDQLLKDYTGGTLK